MQEGTVVMVTAWTKLKNREIDVTNPIVGTVWFWKKEKEVMVMLPSGDLICGLEGAVFPVSEQS